MGDPATVFRIESMGRDDIDGVAEVHRRAFPGYFLTHLGDGFLRRFYSEFCRHSYDYAVVARHQGTGRIVAFVAGTSRARRHLRWLYFRHAPYLALRIPFLTVSDPVVRAGIARRLRGMMAALRTSVSGDTGHRDAVPMRPSSVCPARLLSIAADPAFHGTGVARLASEAFEARVKAAGHDRVGLSVHSDNERAIAFYLKTGWTVTHRSPAGWWFEKAL